MDERLLSNDEAADLLGVSPRTLENWRFKKRGPAYITLEGKSVRYRRADLEAYLKARTVGA